jgi:tetratricopeptide (TPR) repeat protein
MKTNILKVLLIFLSIEMTCNTFTSTAVITGSNIQDRDTSRLFRFINEARYNSNKPGGLKTMKLCIDSAEAICRKENLELPGLLRLARAEYFYLIEDYKNSPQEATIALKLANETKEYELQVKTYIFLGKYNLRIGFFKESIENFKEAISIAEKHKFKKYTGRGYDGIADVYNTIGDTQNYKKTLQLLIDEGIKEKDTIALEDGLYRLGSLYTEKERNFSRADSMLSRCFELSLIRKDTSFSDLSSANMGWNFYKEKKYDLAIKSYTKSLKYSIPSKRYPDAANAFGNLGTINRDLGNMQKAIDYYNKSIEQALLSKNKNEIAYNLSWVYKDMSDMYIQKKDTGNAYKTYILYNKYYDDFTSMTNRIGLAEAKTRYDADAHSKEMQLLSLKLSNQKILIYSYTALFILSLAIGILLFSRSKINSKRKISEMNRRIAEITQANLRQQMNPHFIFNTLNSIQYYMYQHDKLATNNYLTKFSSLMRKVLENSQHTSVSLRDELEALKLYLELEMIRFKDKFDYELKVDEEIDTLLYKVPTMLIQPYVENSISHGLMPIQGKGLVKINLKLENEFISCTIEDNGIGREAAQEKKKSTHNNHNSLGTQIVSSRLDLVNALYGTSLKTIYTDLKNIDGEPEGTLVEIQIPILT